MEHLAAFVSFGSALLLNILIVWYAFSLRQKMGKDGLLGKVTVYAALSSLVFGLHHALELLLDKRSYGLIVAEGIEGIAAILLGIAVFTLYKLAKE